MSGMTAMMTSSMCRMGRSLTNDSNDYGTAQFGCLRRDGWGIATMDVMTIGNQSRCLCCHRCWQWRWCCWFSPLSLWSLSVLLTPNKAWRGGGGAQGVMIIAEDKSRLSSTVTTFATRLSSSAIVCCHQLKSASVSRLLPPWASLWAAARAITSGSVAIPGFEPIIQPKQVGGCLRKIFSLN
jgi:hypothetical protein